jgi:hypothetical protein
MGEARALEVVSGGAVDPVVLAKDESPRVLAKDESPRERRLALGHPAAERFLRPAPDRVDPAGEPRAPSRQRVDPLRAEQHRDALSTQIRLPPGLGRYEDPLGAQLGSDRQLADRLRRDHQHPPCGRVDPDGDLIAVAPRNPRDEAVDDGPRAGTRPHGAGVDRAQPGPAEQQAGQRGGERDEREPVNGRALPAGAQRRQGDHGDRQDAQRPRRGRCLRQGRKG